VNHMYQFRTIAHGTCALDGRHTSEEWAAECPLLGRNAQERLEAFRRQRRARQTRVRSDNA
jgi:hypothetical protein